MSICEMEPVLSLWERPAAKLPVFSSARLFPTDLSRFQKGKKYVKVDLATRDQFPQRKEHPQLAESFVELGHFARRASSQFRSDSNQRLSRIHSEMRNCGARSHPYYDIYICESNFGLWKVVMEGTLASLILRIAVAKFTNETQVPLRAPTPAEHSFSTLRWKKTIPCSRPRHAS
jgi:hypothetical protein